MSRQYDPYNPQKEYSQLTLSDLLKARELNHYDLLRKPNVVATAIGYYLIRKSDPWPSGKTETDAERAKAKQKKLPRTLGNSEVRSYSWPCLLVFVDTWQDEKDLGPRQVVDDSVYLDGRRRVPVCVVWAPRIDSPLQPLRNVIYPSSKIGGGFPILARVQGDTHIASVGCLVSDGHLVYALTNRHVAGEPGERLYARIGGNDVEVGVASVKQLESLPFEEIYGGLAGKQTKLHLDIGLIRVNDVHRWTAQVHKLGTVGPMVNIGAEDPLLRLIDCPVKAYGCASGLMEGAVKALFYRYEIKAGEEYVSDFLIGARDQKHEMQTHPGDSGTLWVLETQDKGIMPLALQWGGHRFNDGGNPQQLSLALATCLSTVCDRLGVDLIRDWNISPTEYWGEMGHYTVGAMACSLKFRNSKGQNSKLETLMHNNVDRIGFSDDALKDPEKYQIHQAHYDFVPLADVADDVWRNTRASTDGNNHFADMDQKATSGKYRGKTLLQLCSDSANVDPKVWTDFYDSVAGTNPGALPFRVWQGFDEMVRYLRASNIVGFLAVAGTMAHYVGDACQPLHVSRLHHGYPPLYKGSVAYKVHSVYETDMLNEYTEKIVDGLRKRIKAKPAVQPGAITKGHEAAVRVVQLMGDTIENRIKPSDLVDTYSKGKSPSDRLERLWKDFGEATMDSMADGCVCLAELWLAAWEIGNGDEIKPAHLGPVDTDALVELYQDSDFYPSMSLKKMVPLLTGA